MHQPPFTLSRRRFLAVMAALAVVRAAAPDSVPRVLSARTTPVSSPAAPPVVSGTTSVPWVEPNAIPHTVAATASPRFRAVAETLLAAMTEAEVPGAALGILMDGREEHATFGIESIATHRPVTAETRFQLASLTKPLTATAIMRLITQGKLDLDATVRTYLPDFQLADADVAARVTLRHLLTHTSGWWGGYDVDTGNDEDAIARFLAERLPSLPQIAPLGALFSYNNTGYTILGRLIEVVTRQEYRTAMTHLVLDPLALRATSFVPEEIVAVPHTEGHALDGDTVRVQQPQFLPRNSDPDGGLWSTTRDLMRFACFHLGDGKSETGSRLLHPYTLELMRTPQVAVPGLPLWMGISWFVADQLGLRLVTHSGDSSGQHSEMWLIPERTFALALLTNALPGGATIGGPVLLAALRQYLGIDPTVAATPSAAPFPPGESETVAEYAGRYAVPNLAYVVQQAGDTLLLSTEAHPLPDEIEPLVAEPVPATMSLQATSRDRFVAPEEGLQVTFVRKPDGQVGWIAIGGRLTPRMSGRANDGT